LQTFSLLLCKEYDFALADLNLSVITNFAVRSWWSDSINY